MSLFKHEHRWKLLDIQECTRRQFYGATKVGDDNASIFLYACDCGEHMTKTLDGSWKMERKGAVSGPPERAREGEE